MEKSSLRPPFSSLFLLTSPQILLTIKSNMSRALPTLYIFVCTGLAALLYFFSQNVYWSDSEIWASTVSREVPNWAFGFGLELKPLYYVFMYPGFALAKSLHLWPMQVHRIFFFGVAIFTAVLIFLNLKNRTHYFGLNRLAPFIPFVGALLLMSSSLYLAQAYRVRSDILASTLYLVSIYLLTSKTKATTFLFVGLLTLAAAAVTLNSLIFLPVLLLSVSWKNIKIPKWVMVTCGLIALILTTTFHRGLIQSVYFFIESFSEKNAGLSYFDLRRLEHIKRWLISDLHIFALFFIKIAHDVHCLRKNIQAEALRSGVWGYYLLLILAVHPNRLPFFLMALGPFLLIWALTLPALYDKLQEKLTVRQLQGALGAFVLMCIAHSAFHSSRFFKRSHNYDQRLALEFLSKRIPAHSNLLILDPIGILPYHNSLLWYLGPGQSESNDYTARRFHEVQPDIVLGVQRLDYIWQKIKKDIENLYHDVGYQIYFKKRVIDNINSHSIFVERIYERLFNDYGPILNREWIVSLTATAHGEKIPLLGQLYDESRIDFPKAMEFPDLLPFKKVRSSSNEKIDKIYISVSPAPPFSEVPHLPSLFQFDPTL